MEGPSLVILKEEIKSAIASKVLHADGPLDPGLTNQKFIQCKTHGKLIYLKFSEHIIKIHFMMFGSYSVNKPKENRIAKLALKFKGLEVYFYACSIRVSEKKEFREINSANDVMSKRFDFDRAFDSVKARKDDLICDVLLDQKIFAGSGNIIKNEVLHHERIHPVTEINTLSPKRIRSLIKYTHTYCQLFYKWKKDYVLIKNWKIFRKRKCRDCGGPVAFEKTGKLKRVSFFCNNCLTTSNT